MSLRASEVFRQRRPRGRPERAVQKAIQHEITRRGGLYVLARSVDDVEKVFSNGS